MTEIYSYLNDSCKYTLRYNFLYITADPNQNILDKCIYIYIYIYSERERESAKVIGHKVDIKKEKNSNLLKLNDLSHLFATQDSFF